MAGATFRDVHLKTYLNEEASTANIRAAKAFLQGAKVDDTVVVFVAGHGTHTNDAAADYYFATHEVDVANLRNTAAPFELFEGLLQDIAPRRKLFLMDTCESGERDPESIAASSAGTGQRGLRSRSTRGLVLDAQPTAPAAAPARGVAAVDRERYIYNDLARRTGAIVFSSSRGTESSFERESWENGAFTAELKAAIGSSVADANNDGMVSTEELRRYVSSELAKRTDDLQHPTVDRDNLEVVLELPVGAKGRPANR